MFVSLLEGSGVFQHPVWYWTSYQVKVKRDGLVRPTRHIHLVRRSAESGRDISTETGGGKL